jgi:hypothetical protein
VALSVAAVTVPTPLRGVVQDKLSVPNGDLLPPSQPSIRRRLCMLHAAACLPRIPERREHDGRSSRIGHVGSRRFLPFLR